MLRYLYVTRLSFQRDRKDRNLPMLSYVLREVFNFFNVRLKCKSSRKVYRLKNSERFCKNFYCLLPFQIYFDLTHLNLSSTNHSWNIYSNMRLKMYFQFSLKAAGLFIILPPTRSYDYLRERKKS